ncbi:hypothetical protein M422DRAFT_108001, partial [Sphaerobolus stellatus SS14]
IEPFIDPALFTPSKRARIMAESLLQSTSGSYLVSSDPIKSHYLPFAPVLEAPPRVSEADWNLLKEPDGWRPVSNVEEENRQLRIALGAAQHHIQARDSIIEGNCAQMIIQNLHTLK